MFLLDQDPFCGATGTLCFELWTTLPMSFKARLRSFLAYVQRSPEPSLFAGTGEILK